MQCTELPMELIRELRISDLTHEIPQYDIWEASYRLIQTVSYWREGSVFVSVVDSGSRIHKTEHRRKDKRRTVYRISGQRNSDPCKTDHWAGRSKSD